MHGDFIGIGDEVGPKCKEEFYNTVREKGIPEENVLNFIDHGKGIMFFPLTIPFIWHINIRKQMNLLKISSSTSSIFFKIRYYKKERKERGKKG